MIKRVLPVSKILTPGSSALLAAFLCMACGQPPILEREVALVQNPATDLAELGRFTRVVRLDSQPEALLGAINEIKLDPQSGDLLIADYMVTDRVYRFSPQGRFLRSYGGLGKQTRIYRTLMSFAPLPQGRLVLLSDELLMRFGSDGEQDREQSVNGIPTGLQVHEDRIYVYAMYSHGRLGNAVTVYDLDLNKVDSFLPMDPRQRVVPFLTRHCFAQTEQGFFIADTYDFALAAYSFSGEAIESFRFPSHNADLEPLWRQARAGKLSLDDQKRMVDQLHRPLYTFGFGRRLYMLEGKKTDLFYRTALFDPEDGTLTVYPNLDVVRQSPAAYPTVNGLAGSWSGGVIGYIQTREFYEVAQAQFPELRDAPFSEKENPLILFFQFNERADREAVSPRATPPASL